MRIQAVRFGVSGQFGFFGCVGKAGIAAKNGSGTVLTFAGKLLSSVSSCLIVVGRVSAQGAVSCRQAGFC